jgi:hypothetical protein
MRSTQLSLSFGVDALDTALSLSFGLDQLSSSMPLSIAASVSCPHLLGEAGVAARVHHAAEHLEEEGGGRVRPPGHALLGRDDGRGDVEHAVEEPLAALGRDEEQRREQPAHLVHDALRVGDVVRDGQLGALDVGLEQQVPLDVRVLELHGVRELERDLVGQLLVQQLLVVPHRQLVELAAEGDDLEHAHHEVLLLLLLVDDVVAQAPQPVPHLPRGRVHEVELGRRLPERRGHDAEVVVAPQPLPLHLLAALVLLQRRHRLAHQVREVPVRERAQVES